VFTGVFLATYITPKTKSTPEGNVWTEEMEQQLWTLQQARDEALKLAGLEEKEDDGPIPYIFCLMM